MNIKTQKILMYIPIVNYFIMFYFVFAARKRLQISSSDFLKCTCKIFLFLILFTIPRIIVDSCFDNKIPGLILYYVSLYVYPLIIAYFFIECQQRYIDGQNDRFTRNYEQNTAAASHMNCENNRSKNILRLLSFIPFLNIAVAVYCIIKRIIAGKISLKTVLLILGVCLAMTVLRALIDVADKVGSIYKAAVPVSLYIQAALITNFVI